MIERIALVTALWCGLGVSAQAEHAALPGTLPGGQLLPPSLAGPASRPGLSESRGWQAIVKTWNEAEAVATGKKGEYPFDQAGKTRLLQSLAQARGAADTLVTQGLLSAAEAGLVQADLGFLETGVQAHRPTEMMAATCYEPMMLAPGRDSLRRLSERLPYLKKLAGAGTVHAAVLARVADRIEADLAVLGKPDGQAHMTPDERARARQVRDEARRALTAIRKKVQKEPSGSAGSSNTAAVPRVRVSVTGRVAFDPSLPAWSDGLAGPASRSVLQESATWQRVVKVWSEAEEVASGRRGAYPFDGVGKKAMLEALAQVGNDVDALARQGLVTSAEASLLAKDLERLTLGVSAKRPTEMQMATCYKPMMIRPGRDSLRRLSERLPLLERMAASNVVHPEVLARVTAQMQRDLDTLASGAGDLDATERERAKSVQAAVKARLRELRKRAGDSGEGQKG